MMQTPLTTTLTTRDLAASSAAVFSSPIGWIALVMRENVLRRVSFGHRGADAAAAAVGLGLDYQGAMQAGPAADFGRRLIRYAHGEFDDFLDVEVDIAHLSPFSAAVVAAVRRIPYGCTHSYGEVASLVGSPRASRAVGSVMAKNRTPLVVPCHRVLGSGGALGGYSAIDGVNMKRRLLELEANRAVAPGV